MSPAPMPATPVDEISRTVDLLLEQAADDAMRGRFVDARMNRAHSLWTTARMIAPPSAVREWPTFWNWVGMLWAASLKSSRYGAR